MSETPMPIGALVGLAIMFIGWILMAVGIILAAVGVVIALWSTR